MLVVLLLMFVLSLQIAASQAQTPPDANVCPALVMRALRELEDNCSGMDRNSACYGYRRLNATFTREVSAEFFTQPSDRTDLVSLRSLTTAPIDLAAEEWGVALMNLQANVPNTLPGQAVTFILMGDATVVNAVAPEDALLPTDPIVMTTAVETELRTGPGFNTNVVGRVPAETAVDADALSEDGAWVRVVAGTQGGWVTLNALTPADTSALPVITSETHTPMQSFLFRTGLGDPLCEDAPDAVVVQGPQNIEVALNVNGADIVLGSTVMFNSFGDPSEDILSQLDLPPDVLEQLRRTSLQTVAADETCALMQMTVVNGAVLLDDGSFALPEGNTAWAVVCVQPDPESEDDSFEALFGNGTLSFESDWGAFRVLTQEELDRLRTLELLPPSLLSYPIDIPEADQLTPAVTPTSTPNIVYYPPTATPLPTWTPIPTNTPQPPPPPPPPDTPVPPRQRPAVITATQGQGQSAPAGTPFGAALQARVTAANGQPIPGVLVGFLAPDQGPSGTFGASGTNLQVVPTDVNGLATASTFTSNGILGAYVVSAGVIVGPATIISTEFSLTNLPGLPAVVSAVSGSGQSAEVYSTFGSPLVARVTDSFGNPLAGVDVTFTLPGESPSAIFANESQTYVDETGADGTAASSTIFADGTLGSYSAVASVEGVADTASFALTNVVGAPYVMTAVSGDGQSAAVGADFGALQVGVYDASSNPIAGVEVTFSAPGEGASGKFGGSLTAQATTDANGVASAPTFTANEVLGSYSVGAGGAGLSTSFALTNVVGGPAAMNATGGDGQSASINTAFSSALQVTVTDAFGNPISGVDVTFSAPAEGASAIFPDGNSTQTDASGNASVSVSANGVEGSYSVTAAGGGLGASFNLTNTPPPNPVPVLSGLSPSWVETNSGAFTLTIRGSGFISSSTAYADGQLLASSFISANEIQANVSANLTLEPGALSITVASPFPGGGTSNALTLNVGFNPID